MPGVDKTLTEAEAVAELRSGMTIGIGGWGSRRKPMSVVREILRTDLTDLTVVAYGGPDVGLLCRAGKVSKVVSGFVSLDSIPLEPNYRIARQTGSIEAAEWDEGMLLLGLQAAGWRVPFLPTRAGLGSDIPRVMPDLSTVRSPTRSPTPVSTRSSWRCPRCNSTRPSSTSTAATAPATRSGWARTRSWTTCSCAPPSGPSSAASGSCPPRSWRAART
ncbi:MAG: CoA-transferase [Microthrixaceae bacterium]